MPGAAGGAERLLRLDPRTDERKGQGRSSATETDPCFACGERRHLRRSSGFSGPQRGRRELRTPPRGSDHARAQSTRYSGLQNSTGGGRRPSIPCGPESVEAAVHGGWARSSVGHRYHYIRTWQGWLYLAVVMDLYARRIVGWSMKPSLARGLVLDAIVMAVWRRRPGPGLIVHSDQGSQGGFKGSLQQYRFEMIVGDLPGFPQGFANRGSYGGGC